MSSNFICNTSNFVAKSAQELKEHYASDWYRYNLKRKAAGMPPVTKENFELRVAELKKQEALKLQQSLFKCPYSGKVFKSEGAWKNYLKSKKYQELKKKHVEETGVEEELKVIKPEVREKEYRVLIATIDFVKTK